ncbi:MAG: YbbR-like domain-containing protein, partial [Candidatus Fimadaptatus sp.]
MNTLKNVLRSIWGWIKRAVLSNFWMKIFSLVLAVGLWCFVLTNDTTITRERTLTNMYVTTTNQSTLDSRELAITEVLSDILPQVRVSIEVTQGDYYRVTSNNVRVELDLSRIRETGEQTIPLTASTVYGTVTGIYPDSVTLNVDELATRNVQVEVQLKGTDDAECWYSSPQSNPTIVTVIGPASQVEQVTNARAVMDLTDLKTTGQVTRAVAFALLDEHQKPVEYGTLSTSTSSVITSVEAYPVENIPVET